MLSTILFSLSIDVSLQLLVGQRFDTGHHLTYRTDTPFQKYGIDDFHLCVPTTNTAYVYSWVPYSSFPWGLLLIYPQIFLSQFLVCPVRVRTRPQLRIYCKVPCYGIRHTSRFSSRMEGRSKISIHPWKHQEYQWGMAAWYLNTASHLRRTYDLMNLLRDLSETR